MIILNKKWEYFYLKKIGDDDQFKHHFIILWFIVWRLVPGPTVNDTTANRIQPGCEPVLLL